MFRCFISFLCITFISGCSKKLVLDGATTYDLKQYSVAPALLQKDFDAAGDAASKKEIALKIGDSYSRYNQYAKAEKWYKQAADLGAFSALLKQGMMQMAQENYAEAIKTFTKLSKVDAVSKLQATNEIKNCERAIEWKAANSKITIENVASLNSPKSDFAPVWDNGKLYFSSSRSEAKGKEVNAWTNEKNADIFFSEKDKNGFGKVFPFDTALNSNYFEGTMAFTNNGNDIYFTRCQTLDLSSTAKIKQAKNEYCHIFFSRKVYGEWGEPEMLALFPDTVNVGHPVLSRDAKLLVVSSDAPRGFGGKDLYYFIKTDTGWSAPYNAGADINTKGDEMFPWLDEVSNLYFSSNGHSGMGGLDIFRAAKFKSSWKEPQNLKSPINSGADDFSYTIDKYKPKNVDDLILTSGYFSSNRAGGKGGDDIYYFEEGWVNYFVLNGKVQEKKYENPENPDSKLLGMKPLEKVKVILKSSADSIAILSNAAGVFNANLKSETDYKLTYYKPGYFSATGFVSTKGKRNQDSTYIYLNTLAELDKIFTQKEIVIPNIYYDYNKATLRPESKIVLDSILIFFNSNKELIIEIGSHTDSRGGDAYNEKLSQARAQSVVDYLIEKGIEKDRLAAKGYGEARLVNNCANDVNCTEEEHQKNRRTTFRITGSKQIIQSIEPEDVNTVPKD
jgi:outer membrane protein OmpA-like peptidoglycan-associated protein